MSLVPNVGDLPPLGLSALTVSALPTFSYFFPTCNRKAERKYLLEELSLVTSWEALPGLWHNSEKVPSPLWLRAKICLIPEPPVN